MNDKYSINKLDDITVIRLHEDLDLKQTFAVMDEVAQMQESDLRIWDLTKCFSFTADQVRQIAEHGKKKWPMRSKVAYIAADDLAFGLLRMLEVYRNKEHYQTMVCHTEGEALTWFENVSD